MFDKIFKFIALIIFGFIAYSFYLHALNIRYYPIANKLVVLDKQTGNIVPFSLDWKNELSRLKTKSRTKSSIKPRFKTKEEALNFLREPSKNIVLLELFKRYLENPNQFTEKQVKALYTTIDSLLIN